MGEPLNIQMDVTVEAPQQCVEIVDQDTDHFTRSPYESGAEQPRHERSSPNFQGLKQEQKATGGAGAYEDAMMVDESGGLSLGSQCFGSSQLEPVCLDADMNMMDENSAAFAEQQQQH